MQFLQRASLLVLGCICTYIILTMLLQQIPLEDDLNHSTQVVINETTYSLNTHEKNIFNSLPTLSTGQDHPTIIGHDKTKTHIDSIISLIQDSTEARSHYPGLEIPKAILLYGPPGTGKTTLANKIAHQIGFKFLHISPDMIENKFYGEGIKKLRAVFTLAKKISPSVIFFDEIDGFMSSRSSMDQSHTNTMKTIFLTSMDSISESDRVLVIGATNRRDSLDTALLRRLDVQLYMGFPSLDDKMVMIQRFFPNISKESQKEFIEHLGPGKSLSDIKNTCKTCVRILYTNKKDMKEVSLDDLTHMVSDLPVQ